VLPEIQSAFAAKPKAKSVGNRKNHKMIEVEKLDQNKKVEYVHEEFHDNQGKWTFFNKHALEIDEESEKELENSQLLEDKILENLKLDDGV